MSDNVRVRFAPSPTGNLHLGTARTALFNWLFARGSNGIFVLRIEDTDRERSTTVFERSIIEDLAWLGLTWDEGPDIGGPLGPYRQTERAAAGLYERAARALLKSEHAYECFCSSEELEAERKSALAHGKTPRYSGKCRQLTPARRRQLIEGGQEPAVRFAVPQKQTVSFNDMIRGKLDFTDQAFGDFIILRKDRSPTYNLAVVVDDSAMKISHVLRGEDHIANTARQLLIFNALGLDPPKFGHFSMILGPDQAKLSKRSGAAAIADYRRSGYLAESIINYLSLLSWSSPSGEEVLDMATLTADFSLKRVSKSPAIFDISKLKWLNSQHIRRLDNLTLTNLIIPYLVESEFVDAHEIPQNFDRLTRITESAQTSMEVLSDIQGCAKIFDEVIFAQDVVERLSEKGSRRIIDIFTEVMAENDVHTKDEAKNLINAVGGRLKTEGFKGKDIFQTLRLALTGELSGPELFYIIWVLGQKEILERLKLLS